MKSIKEIFENNKKWVADKMANDENYFKNLDKGQNPEILYIGCSDSRVSAEDLMGVQPGEVFVHRNIANLVPSIDLNSQTVINFAVRYLKVSHIVICGHYSCGGIKAAMQTQDMGILNPWLRNIRDVYRHHKKELLAIENIDKRYDRLVELNVEEQCFNVLKLAAVQEAFRTREISLHGWVFDIYTGKIIDLKIDLGKMLKEIEEIYKLE